MKRLVVTAIAVLTMCATAQAHDGYLHMRDASRAADRYLNVSHADHATTTCRRWSPIEIDCKVTLRGVDPDGNPDPSWTSAWTVVVTLRNGSVRTHFGG